MTEHSAISKFLVIEDHRFVLQGCHRVLRDIGVADILHASNLADGFRVYRKKKPDVVVMNLVPSKEALAGLSFIRRLRLHDKQTPLLVIATGHDPVIAGHALRFGANAYILKDTSSEDIPEALKEMSEGRTYLSHAIAIAIAVMDPNPISNMTFRELQTLELIARCKHYDDIADELNMSYRTVASICADLKVKLGAKSLRELMKMALAYFPDTAARPMKQPKLPTDGCS